MQRREFLQLCGLAGAAGACSTAAAQPPNVLFIAVDDLNDWLGCLGGHPHAKTPNMDRLAARGVLFDNAHCQAPICGPSRASLMSGLRPSSTGIYGQINDERVRKAHPKLAAGRFLPEYFAEHGYHTMGVGKLFHQHAPQGVFEDSGGREAGFGPKPPKRLKWDANKTSTDWGAFPERDEEMPDFRTAEWALERLGREQDKPFFLGVGLLRPHVPWHVPTKWFDLHPPDELEMPPYLPSDYDDIPEISRRLHEVPMMPTTDWAIQSGEWKYIVQAYLACVSFADHYVGKVLDALEASPYADNTYVVLWGDHGYHIGEKNRFAKHSVWEEATKAPLMIAGPGIAGGRVCSKPAELIDLYPTLLELCGLPPNAANEGHSLGPLLDDPQGEWPYAAITTYGRNNHGVRTERWRYIRFEDGSEELYDHQADQNEWENLAALPEHAETIAKLRAYLPEVNEPWSPESTYDYNGYLTEQRERELRR